MILGGRFELVELLGSGGVAEVWRARDTTAGAPVAIKRLLPQLASDRQVRQKLLILVDGAAEIDADSEFEEVEHAPEQERVIAGDYCFLAEDRRALGLNLKARHHHCRAAAAFPLDLVEEGRGEPPGGEIRIRQHDRGDLPLSLR